MEHLSAKEALEKWCISKRRVQLLCNLGRINGVTHVGNMFLIPKDDKKPEMLDVMLNQKKAIKFKLVKKVV